MTRTPCNAPVMNPGRRHMKEDRRERIRELIGMLEGIQEQVQRHRLDEEAEEAVLFLEQADTDIANAIEQLRFAAADDSLPEL